MAPDDEDLEPSRLEAAAEIVESIRRIEKLTGRGSQANNGHRFDALRVNAVLAAMICVACVICVAVATLSLIG